MYSQHYKQNYMMADNSVRTKYIGPTYKLILNTLLGYIIELLEPI